MQLKKMHMLKDRGHSTDHRYSRSTVLRTKESRSYVCLTVGVFTLAVNQKVLSIKS